MRKGTTSYRIKDENELYFLTFSTVQWIDLFTNKKYRDIVVESLSFCQKEKGLEIFSWCIMSNHVHLIVRAKEGYKLSHIIRDMKKFTSKKIIKVILEDVESRKGWLLTVMKNAGKQNSKKQTYQLWRNDNHPIELIEPEIIDQKLDYIHNNPIEAGIVVEPEQYLYSSARDYANVKGLPEITFP